MSVPSQSMRGQRLSLAIAAIALAASAAVATAELYRCVRADGSTVFTDSQATCPGVPEHHPTGEVQNYRPAAPARAAASRTESPATTASRSADSEASWREKKHQTAEELSAITAHINQISPFVKTCNRGGSVYRTLENGLRSGVSCEWLRDEIPKLERQRNALQDYLDHGLHDECRKSGCFPGWLR